MDLYYFENDILNFYDIQTEGEEEALLTAILKYAESVDKAAFTKEVRSVFPQGQMLGRGVIYEALGKKSEEWSDFFVEEYRLAFEEAKESTNAFEILDGLEEMSFAEDTGFGKEIIQILEAHLDHPNPVIRYKAIWCMGDWIGEENKQKYPHIIRKIKEKLKDKHWKIRCMTKLILGDMNALPVGFELGFFDKMRAKWGSIFQM